MLKVPLTPTGMRHLPLPQHSPTVQAALAAVPFVFRDMSPGASQGQLLASSLAGGFSFDIHTTVSTPVLTDQVHKDLL